MVVVVVEAISANNWWLKVANYGIGVIGAGKETQSNH